MAALATNRPYQVTRNLIEIRDGPDDEPELDRNNNSPWRIRKTLETQEIATGKIQLTHKDVFDHVFRYWSLESANYVVTGNKGHVTVCDLTDENSGVMYGPFDEQTFFEKGLQDEYVLGLNMAMFRSRGFKKGDEIGLYFDARTQVFYFKAFR